MNTFIVMNCVLGTHAVVYRNSISVFGFIFQNCTIWNCTNVKIVDKSITEVNHIIGLYLSLT